jgi:hypothetical protein
MSQTTDRTVSTFARDAAAQVTAQSRNRTLMDEVLQRTLDSGFDADAWRVMDERDTRLLQDEILGGPKSSKFLYDFRIQNTTVRGISAVGARELATYYKNIRHRLVSSTRKVGPLFIFTTYAGENVRPDMHTVILPDLKDEPDGYEVVVEVEDFHTGIRMQAAKFESQWEYISAKDDGAGRWREKAHFATIAQSKAQRNGILMVVPQSIQLAWMESLRDVTKSMTITQGVLDEKRSGVLRYSASKGIPIDRNALRELLLEQIIGLSEAARTGEHDLFLAAATALRLIPLDGASASGTTSGTTNGMNGSGATTVNATTNVAAGNTAAPTADVGRGTRRRPPNAPETARRPAAPSQDQRGPAVNPDDPDAFRREMQPARNDMRTGPEDMRPEPSATQKPSLDFLANSTEPTTRTEPTAELSEKMADEGTSNEEAPGESAFEAWLVMPDGTAIFDNIFSDPAMFAHALVRVSEELPDDFAAIWTENKEAIDDAYQMNADARQVLDRINPTRPVNTEQPTVAVPRPVVVPKTDKGADHWPNYAANCKTELDRLTTLGEVDTWESVNGPTYRDKLQPKTLIARLLVATRERIGATASASATETTMIPAIQDAVSTSAEDRELHIAESLIDELRHFKTETQVIERSNQMALKTPMARWAKDNRPDLVAKVREAYTQRLAAIAGAKG